LPKIYNSGWVEQKIEIMKKTTDSKKKFALIEENYYSIVDFIEQMDQVGRFQNKLDITASISRIWELLLEEIQNLIETETCALFLVDKTSREFVLESVSPENQRSLCEKELEAQIESGMFALIINRRLPALIPSFTLKKNKQIIMLPVATVKRTLGVVMVFTPINESALRQEEMKLLAMLIRQSSIVMENRLLYEDLRHEHEALQKVRKQIFMAEKIASLGRLTSGASHEILNPLNVISGNIQLLLMNKDINSDIKKRFNIISEQVDRIDRIIKGLSRFSQHGGTKTEKININEVLENALSFLEHQIRLNNVQIVKDYGDDLPEITGDSKGLFQVLFNFISNAKDATPNNGTISVSTRFFSTQPENPGVKPGKKGFVEIKFSDTGCGISKENIDKIFDPFFTTKENVNGTGLGLSISFGIIQDQGGKISVESEVDKGTCFTVSLPV